MDPHEDSGIINMELALADLDCVEKQKGRVNRVARTGDKEAQATMVFLEKLAGPLSEGTAVRTLDLSDDELDMVKGFHLLTSKPTMYIANVADDGFEDNPHLDAVNTFAAVEGATVVAICNQIEAEVSELDDEDKREFLSDIGMTEPDIDRAIRAGYELLIS